MTESVRQLNLEKGQFRRFAMPPLTSPNVLEHLRVTDVRGPGLDIVSAAIVGRVSAKELAASDHAGLVVSLEMMKGTNETERSTVNHIASKKEYPKPFASLIKGKQAEMRKSGSVLASLPPLSPLSPSNSFSSEAPRTTEWQRFAIADFISGTTNTTMGLLGLVCVLALLLYRLAAVKRSKEGLAEKMV